MDELEYGTVVLRFGRDLPPQVSKVYCKGVTLKVPTGRSGADLTIEPSLITTAVSRRSTQPHRDLAHVPPR
ncbi:hypothetical protein DDE74_37060 [Streptomyces lydicus]|uniref:Uncharacterized protein n=1 Tax=Streptomyces lydicus TaxID=47763 RepID=A0A3S9YLN1_9ACTN|nr:hypothetical protein DDE74_37060 [Streptomyces lydicus]